MLTVGTEMLGREWWVSVGNATVSDRDKPLNGSFKRCDRQRSRQLCEVSRLRIGRDLLAGIQRVDDGRWRG